MYNRICTQNNYLKIFEIVLLVEKCVGNKPRVWSEKKNLLFILFYLHIFAIYHILLFQL